MRYSTRSLIVTAGLAGVLAIGLVGCSTSSTHTEETTLTTTDGGETTSTTTTTQAEENGSTTTETTTSTETASEAPLHYVNEAFGFEATLPADYVEKEPETSNDGEETMLYAANNEGNTVFIKWRDLTVEPTFEGPQPWADAYATSLKAALETNGDTDISMTTSEGKLAGVPCIILECQSKAADGTEQYRDYFFMVANTDDGLQGLYVGAMASDSASLDNLENCFRGIE